MRKKEGTIFVIMILLTPSLIVMETKKDYQNDSMQYKINDEVTNIGYGEENFYFYFVSQSDYEIGLLIPHRSEYKNLRIVEYTQDKLPLLQNFSGEIYFSSKYQVFETQDLSVETDYETIDQLDIHYMDELTDDGFDGSGVKVGIIDGSIDFDHSYIDHLTYVKKNFNGFYPLAPSKHGTAIASTIAGISDSDQLGFAINVTIYAAQMGSQSYGTISGDFIGAFEWLIAEGVDVINTSFGPPVGGLHSVWEPVIKRVYENNITLVGAVGNLGLNPWDGNNDPFTASGPGNSPYAIAVGAIAGAGGMYHFTSEGPTYSYEVKPDLVAKGVGVRAAKDAGISQYAGTSVAAGIMTGGIAVMIQAMKSKELYSPAALKASLMTSTYPVMDYIYNYTWESEYLVGQGIANFSEAWMDIKSNNLTRVIVTPHSLPYDFQIYYPRGGRQILHAWVYSAVDPSQLSVSVTGNISQILEINPFSYNSQKIPVILVSDKSDPFGNYTGVITIHSQGYSDSVDISIIMETDFKGNIMIDNQFTYYDDDGGNRIPGYNLKNVVERLWRSGYIFSENRGHFNNETLLDIDILWFANLFSGLPLFVDLERAHYSNSDRDEINHFIEGGGSVLADFYGKFSTNNQYRSSSIYSSQYPVFDWLFEGYNMDYNPTELPEQLIFDHDTWEVPSSGEIGLTDTTPSMTHLGNYVKIVNMNDFRSTAPFSLPDRWQDPIVLHELLDGGKIAIISTPILRDDLSLNNDYTSKNFEIFENILDWLQSEKFVMGRPEREGEKLIGDLVYEGTNTLTANLIVDGIEKVLPLSKNGSEYNYEFTLSQDDKDYHIHVGDTQKYLKKTYRVDSVAPIIHGLHPLDEITYPFTLEYFIDEPNIAEYDLLVYLYLPNDEYRARDIPKSVLTQEGIFSFSLYKDWGDLARIIVEISVTDIAGTTTTENFYYNIVDELTYPTSDPMTDFESTTPSIPIPTINTSISNEEAFYPLIGLLVIPVLVWKKKLLRE